MKIKLTLILSAITMYCAAQQVEYPIDTIGARYVYDSTMKDKDTVKTILLVIDTYTGATSTINILNKIDQATNDRRIPFWIYANAIRIKRNASEGIIDPGFCANCIYRDYMETVGYLDEYKKPLSKTIHIIQEVK